MGEDIGKLGGVFRVTDGLQKDFGEDRVIDTPLAETGIVGTAIGLAMRGYRPVVEIQFDGFVFPAFDQIVTQLAKMHARSDGQRADADHDPHPVRRRHRRGRAPQRVARRRTSRTPPGLRVVTCRRNPADAYWMIQQAIASDDPVVFFEPKRRYWDKAEVDDASTSRRAVAVHRRASCGRARDVTVACYGPMVRTCLEAADGRGGRGPSTSR